MISWECIAATMWFLTIIIWLQKKGVGSDNLKRSCESMLWCHITLVDRRHSSGYKVLNSCWLYQAIKQMMWYNHFCMCVWQKNEQRYNRYCIYSLATNWII
jgi:hypothetical protein